MKSNKIKKEFKKAVNAYLKGKANEEQLLFIQQYFDLFNELDEVLVEQDFKFIEFTGDRIHSNINKLIEERNKKGTDYLKFVYLVAAVISVTILSVHLYQGNSVRRTTENHQIAANTVSGKRKTTLTLFNGIELSLADLKTGEVTNQLGTIVTKTKDGQLIYRNSGSAKETLAYNKIETPKGGGAQVQLPDGTKVWLNASSSLKYPLLFHDHERKIELTGEAYFEVSKDKTKPFKVYSSGQVVEVLGTHFNIKAYSGEPSVKTTLLEGIVRVSNLVTHANVVIKPGQQSTLLKGNSSHQVIEVKNIDVAEAVAWKNGYFMFNDESLESVLREISRWYDVDIQYQRESLKHQLFSGTLSRYANVSQVLRKLELTQSVHFKIEGRHITVME